MNEVNEVNEVVSELEDMYPLNLTQVAEFLAKVSEGDHVVTEDCPLFKFSYERDLVVYNSHRQLELTNVGTELWYKYA